MKQFEVFFSIRKGLGPDWFDKIISVGLDDVPKDMSELSIRKMAIDEAEKQLYTSEDYRAYGKNWILKEVYESKII